jgi:hypothetical protein
MAVGSERAHAEFVGEGEGPLVVGCDLIDIQGSVMRGDLAEQAQGIRLVATFLVLAGMRQRALGEGLRLLRMTGQ